MTVDYTKLALVAHGNNKKLFYYDAGSDTMATVMADGYFNNLTGVQKIAADDIIFCQCADGDFWFRANSVNADNATASAGVVYGAQSGGDGPWNGVVGSASGSITVPGISELGTGTATAHVLSRAPRVGEVVRIAQTGTATGGISVITSSTGVTIDAAGDRTLNFTGKGQNAALLGVSTTRWVLIGGNFGSISA